MILLDTNILIHSNQHISPHFNTITNRLIDFADSDEELVVCPQVLYEFYVVATRPVEARGGLGISSKDALSQIQKFHTNYLFIHDSQDLFSIWLQLIKKYGSLGTSAHDTRLVAFMKSQKIDQLYTMNRRHFNRYAHIITILN
jgi:predicted nucleic acid-binding protein